MKKIVCVTIYGVMAALLPADVVAQALQEFGEARTLPADLRILPSPSASYDYSPLRSASSQAVAAAPVFADTVFDDEGRALVRLTDVSRMNGELLTTGRLYWIVDEHAVSDPPTFQLGVIVFAGWMKISIHTAFGVDKEGHMNANANHRVKVHTKLYTSIVYALPFAGMTVNTSVLCYHDMEKGGSWKDAISFGSTKNTTVHWNDSEGHVVLETSESGIVPGQGWDEYFTDIDGTIAKESMSSVVPDRLSIAYNSNMNTLGAMYHYAGSGPEDILVRDYGLLPSEQFTMSWIDGAVFNGLSDASPISNINLSAGTDISITGTGRFYEGTRKIHLDFTDIPLQDDWVPAAPSDLVYTGEALRPAFTVINGGVALTEGTDYTLTYRDNTDAGTATAVIAPVNAHWEYSGGDSTRIAQKYTGKITRTFPIAPKRLTLEAIPTIPEQTYTGSPLTPDVVVTDGTKTLTLGKDYLMAYLSSTNAGEGTVRIAGIGNYTGEVDKPFTISPKAMPSLPVIAQQTYTGNAFTPIVTLTDEEISRTLTEGTDYTLTYSNNVDVGTATVIATGKGNYTGTQTTTFAIVQRELTDGVTIREVSPTERVYNGESQRPDILTVADGNRVLSEGTDYMVSCIDNINVGTATVNINGIGNYSGTLSTTFDITRRSLSEGKMEVAAGNYVYSGSALTPNVLISDGTMQLTRNKDYTLSVSNNINAGQANITATGMGNYGNNLYGNFTILPKALSSGAVKFTGSNSFTYTGMAFRPDFTVTDGTKTLSPYSDYTYEYADNVQPGTATLTVTGIGNYSGTQTANFSILTQVIEDSWLKLTDKTYTATGEPIYLSFVLVDYVNQRTLRADIDYTVTYSNNVEPGIATMTINGIGSYSGTITHNYTIVAAPAPTPSPYSGDSVEEEPEPVPEALDIASEQISVSVGGTLYNEIIRVTNIDGTVYTEGIDWELTWIVPGTPVLLQLTGKGALTGKRYVWTTWISDGGNTDAEATPAPTLRALSQSNALVLEGLQPSKAFTLHTIEGRKYFSAVAPASGTYTLHGASEGIYILEHAGQRIRVYHNPR